MTLRDHPQRLTPIARPGELSKRLVGAHANLKLRTIGAGRDEAYLANVRQCPCLSCGMDPCGEVSHCRIQSAAFGKHGGMGKKPADRFAAPLCGSCHREDRNALHRVGEAIFWDDLGLNPLLIASKLYAAKGDLVAMRAVIFVAIAERSKR